MGLRLSTLAPSTAGTIHVALNDDGTRIAYSNGHLHLFDEQLHAVLQPVRYSGAVLWRSGKLHVGVEPLADERSPAIPATGPSDLASAEHGFVETLGAWGKVRWHVEGAQREVAAAADRVVSSPRGKRVASWNREEVSLFATPKSKPLRLTHGAPRKPRETPQESIEHLAPTGVCFTDEETLWILWSTWNATVLERRDIRGAVVTSTSLHERLAMSGGRVGLLRAAEHLLVHCTEAIVVIDASSGEVVADLALKSVNVAMSADGTRMASVGHAQELSLIDVDHERWTLRSRVTLRPVGATHAGRWVPNRSTLHVVRRLPDERETWNAAGVAEVKKGTAVVFEVEPRTGELLTSNHTRVASLGPVKLRGRIGEPSSAAFHPSEPLVATGAVVFDLSGKEVATGAVSAAVAALPSGRLLTAAPHAPLSEVSWKGVAIKSIWSAAEGWVRWIVASERSEAFVAVTYGVSASRAFAFTSPEAPPIELEGHAGVPSPSGQHFATIGLVETIVFDAKGTRLARIAGSAYSAEQAHALRFATEDVLLVPMASGAMRLWRWKKGEWLDLFRTGGKDWCAVDDRGQVEGSTSGLKVVLDGPTPTPGLLASWLVAMGGAASVGKARTKAKESRVPGKGR